MPVVNNQTLQTGPTLEPLISPSSNTLLFDGDRAVFFGLEYFAYVINTFVGTRLLQAASSSPAPVTAIAAAVAQKYPDDPAEWLTSNQVKFPLLAMYRKDSEYNQHTMGWNEIKTTFDLLYVLPPLTAGQAENILPILPALEKAILRKTVVSLDPGYTPTGGAAGQSPWGLQFAAVERIGFTRGHIGKWPNTGNLPFPFLHCEGFLVERDMYVGSEQKFAGGDVTTSIVSSDGATLSPFIQVSTQQAPTITSLSVSTGSIAGGTSVTLTGTLFLPGVLNVMFGNTPAPKNSIFWNSATSVTCTSPAISGPGSVPIILQNRDGQIAVGPMFTYTSP